MRAHSGKFARADLCARKIDSFRKFGCSSWAADQVKFANTWKDVCDFKNRLIVARADENGSRISILNDGLKIRSRGGDTQVTKIESSADLLSKLETHFGLRFESGTRFAWNV